MTPQKISWFHLIALLIVLVWGTTFISTKVLLLRGLSPEEIFLYRFVIAYVGIWIFGKSHLFSNSWKDELLFVLLGITGGSLYFLTENYALKFTQASNVALIVCTAPLITALLSHIFLESEKLHRRLVQGSLLALLGVALVVFNGHFVLQLNLQGDVLSLIAALCWGVYTIVLKKASTRYTMLFITRKVFFYGVLTILPIAIAQSSSADLLLLRQPVVLGNILFLGVVASLLCYFFWNLVIKHLGAVKATNYIYFAPLVTLVASSIFLDEIITPLALVGAALILLGVFWAEKKVGKTKP